MASFSYFYDSDQQIYDLVKIYNRQLPHRPAYLKNSKQVVVIEIIIFCPQTNSKNHSNIRALNCNL